MESLENNTLIATLLSIYGNLLGLNVPANILKEDLVESGLNVFDQKLINKYFTLIKSLNMIV